MVSLVSPVACWTLSRLLLAVLLLVPAFAQGVAKRTTSPPSLQKEGGYEHLEALFGDYPHRWVTIEENLIYVRSELCDSEDNGLFQDDLLVDVDDGIVQDDDDDALVEDYVAPDDDPLQEDEATSIVQAESRSVPQPLYKGYILMVDRGSCTFVKKVRNAQRLGAVAVIIADNVCLCSDPDCNENVCETSPPIMADDGSGGDILIPSFLLYKQDADRIKESIANSSSVTMKLEWAQAGITDKVEYELWTTPHVTTRFDRITLLFLSNLDQALGDAAKFTPHQHIVDGVSAGCRINGESVCENLCTNHGRYCAYTDHDWMGVSGRDFVVENLRRLCIRDVYNDRGVWWNYTIEFANRCDTQDFYMNEDCVEDCYQQSGINSTLIENCMRQSGGIDQDNSNSLLDNEIFKENTFGKLFFLPALIVNGRYANPSHELTPTFCFFAICEDYFAKNEPEVCRTCKSSDNVAECVLNFNGSNSTLLGDIVADGLGAMAAGGMRTLPTLSFAFVGILLALFGWV